MASPTYTSLVELTANFFHLHWNNHLLGDCPTWLTWDNFLFGSVPNHAHAGCYAVLFGENLGYVGLGASRGGGIYVEHGISRRLTRNVIQPDRARGRDWSKLRDRYADATAICTIGLPSANYLAASLETYLIRSLFPPMNSRV